jgi:hypothetical protein
MGLRVMDIRSISDFRRAMRHGPYVWPGGYPVYFVMSDGEALSFKEAKKNIRPILGALAENAKRDDWRPVALAVNWEDCNLWCSQSGEKIESAYGED